MKLPRALKAPRPPYKKPRSSMLGFTLIELMVVVAILGIIASAAIPSYIRYIRRTKSTEAAMNVRKMYDAAVMYFASDHATGSGGVIPKSFPLSEGPTPAPVGAVHPCCLSGGGKCAPDPLLWSSPTWNAMHFSVDDPFSFRYTFVSSGVDHSSFFRATASGDLDCDTVASTFERIGSVDSGLNVIGSAGLFRGSDIE